MIKRIFGISVVFFFTALAWMILAGAVTARTHQQDSKLRQSVGQIWGKPIHQEAPTAGYQTRTIEKVTTRTADAVTTQDKERVEYHPVPLSSSRVEAAVSYDPRRKGLLWYNTYKVAFSGSYSAENPTARQQDILFQFKLPNSSAVYDDFRVSAGGRELPSLPGDDGQVTVSVQAPANGTARIEVTYRTNGLDEWWYSFGESVQQVRDFSLVVSTDFDGFDFPPDSVSPTDKKRDGQGWKLTWAYTNLLSGVQPGLALPKKLNPGPWVSEVTFAAPVSLFLFFFLLFIVTTRKAIPLHPMHYFFLGAAFFSFHLLLAYLVDHISLVAGFAVAASVSLLLTVSYIRAAISPRFAFLEVGLGQLLYQILFSGTFFFEAYTGLSITVLCILTLFAVMQYTAKVDWAAAFGGRPSQGV